MDSTQLLQLLQSTSKILSAQHIPEWQSGQAGISQLVDSMPERPAGLGIELLCGGNDFAGNVKSQADVAKAHIAAGGFVMLGIHPPSPWSTDQTIGSVKGTKGDMSQLLAGATASTQKSRWQKVIDNVNAFLDLFPEDSPIIFHPLHEGNGAHFWWGYNMANPSQSNVGLRNLWLDLMTRVHADTRGLLKGFHAGMTWFAPVTHGWPGFGQVHIAGASLYPVSNLPVKFVDKFNNDYLALIGTGAPVVGMFECGPDQYTAPLATATWNSRQMAFGLKDLYPQLKFVMAWHNGPNGFGSWSSFTSSGEALADPAVANLADIQVAAPAPTDKTVFTALRNPVLGVYSTEEAAWAAGADVIAVVQSDIEE